MDLTFAEGHICFLMHSMAALPLSANRWSLVKCLYFMWYISECWLFGDRCKWLCVVTIKSAWREKEWKKPSPGMHPFGLQNAKGPTATPNKLLVIRALSTLLREFFVTENQMMSLSESGWNGMSSHSYFPPLFFQKGYKPFHTAF